MDQDVLLQRFGNIRFAVIAPSSRARSIGLFQELTRSDDENSKTLPPDIDYKEPHKT